MMVFRFYDTASRLIGTLTTDDQEPELALRHLLSREDQWVTVETIPQMARKVQINKVAYIDAIPQSVIDAQSYIADGSEGRPEKQHIEGVTGL